MTPREYLDIARERWRFIVAGVLLGLIVALVVTSLTPRQYQAPVTVIVTVQSDPAAASGGTDEEISSQRLSTYVELMRSRRLAEAVVLALRLPVAPGDLADRIAVTTTPDSALLTATVTDESGEQAVRIANAVAEQFIRDVAEIEQPADPGRSPIVAAKVFEPAAPPAELVAPRPLSYVALGGLLGLLAGLGAALLRHALDFRMKSRRQLEEILGVPVLGSIARDPKIPSSPLVMYGAPHTPLAEAFRQLRTNVSFIDVDREHKVILVTSATSGEGRSTTVSNLGLALAEAGRRVLILDADLRDPAIARYLRVDDTHGLTDVLVNRITVERALQPTGPTLDVLPSGQLPPNPSELLGSDRMVNLLATLRGRYDIILIDTAPLLPVTDAAVLAPHVDGVLVLVRHGRTVVQDVQAAKDALDAVSGRIVGAVMTMVTNAGARGHTRVKQRKGKRRPLFRRPPPTWERRGAAGPVAARDKRPVPQTARPAAEQTAAHPAPHTTQQAAQPPLPLAPPRGAQPPSPRPRSTMPSEANGRALDRGRSPTT